MWRVVRETPTLKVCTILVCGAKPATTAVVGGTNGDGWVYNTPHGQLLLSFVGSHLKSQQDGVPVGHRVWRLIPRRGSSIAAVAGSGATATAGIFLLEARRVQPQGLPAVGAGEEEAHERKEVGLVRVHTLLKQQQGQLSDRAG